MEKPLKGMAYLCFTVVVVIGAVGIQWQDPAAVTKVLAIPANEFLPSTHQVEYYCDGANLYITKENGQAYIRAPLVLPNNCRIDDIKLICKDNDTTCNITVWLHRVNYNHTVSGAVAAVSSDGSSTAWRMFSTTLTDYYINNQEFVHFLNCRLPQTTDEKLCLSHVLIYYKGKY